MFVFSSLLVIAESNIDSVLNNGLSFSEKLSLSLKMILLGMGTVFAVLFIIWLCLTVFKAVMGRTKKKEKGKQAENAAAPAETGDGATPQEDDGALVAAIVAAITAYREEAGEAEPSGFRVVSFTESGAVRPWKKRR